MLSLLKKVFGISPSVDVHDWLQRGAIIVDVRTREEFQSGHINEHSTEFSSRIPCENEKRSTDIDLLCIRDAEFIRKACSQIKRI